MCKELHQAERLAEDDEGSSLQTTEQWGRDRPRIVSRGPIWAEVMQNRSPGLAEHGWQDVEEWLAVRGFQANTSAGALGVRACGLTSEPAHREAAEPKAQTAAEASHRL